MREFLRDAEVGRWEGFRRQRADVHAMKIGLSGTHGRAFAGLMSNIGIKLDAQWKGRSQPPLYRQNEPLGLVQLGSCAIQQVAQRRGPGHALN